jgi:signal transduction histidine kinase
MRDGNAVSQSPATVAFTIMPPIWQRWWFLMLVAVSIVLMAYTLYRYRLARLLELERVRTRIATDLHDDIGSNLSLIAMASEVASRQAHNVDDRMAGWLTLISSTSRETVDSMSDIVWAVNPAKDRLVDLIQRMRRVAEETLTTRNIAFHFRTPEKDAEMRLGAETRREVFMVFKEGVNNIVRHSQSTRADLSMTVAGSLLVLQLIDNGLGFDPSSVEEGNGLASMRRRADKLRGKFETASQPGEGTTITLTVPLDAQRRFRK